MNAGEFFLLLLIVLAIFAVISAFKQGIFSGKQGDE